MFRSEIFFFRTTQELEYFFFVAQSAIFFPIFNFRLYDKNSESYFFIPPPKSEYFFQQHWESEHFFLEKNHNPPLEVKWSVPKCGLKKTELCTFCTENKEILVHIFRECNYVWNFWLSIGNFLKICGLSLPFNAKDIILGLTEHSSAQGIIDNVLIILKYYIYVCRCKCRDLDLEGGLEFLKYAINIEKASVIYLSPVQKERVKRKWLDLEAVLSG